MKKGLLVVLVLILAFACIGCQPEENENNDAKENSQYILDVSFVATVDELIDDPNTGDDVPRYAVVRPFQEGPVLVDVGVSIARRLEEGETYRFVMEQKQNITMVEGKAYDLETLIPLYDLRVESVNEPLEEQTGLDSKNIEYTAVSN